MNLIKKTILASTLGLSALMGTGCIKHLEEKKYIKPVVVEKPKNQNSINSEKNIE